MHMPVESLWTVIQSLSIKNKRWLSDRLMEDLSQSKEAVETTKKEMLDRVVASFTDIKEGRTHPLNELWEQL